MRNLNKILVLASLLASVVAASGGSTPAKYDLACTRSNERIGYSVPGLQPSLANSIINEFPVYAVPNEGYLKKVGYLYPTWGAGHGKNGVLYFVGLTGSVPWARVIFSSIASTQVGENSISSDPRTMTQRLRFILSEAVGHQSAAQHKEIMTMRIAQPCFSSDWDGKYT